MNRRCSASKLSKAEFEDFEIIWRGDIYRNAPQKSAAIDFGVMAIVFRARKSTAV